MKRLYTTLAISLLLAAQALAATPVISPNLRSQTEIAPLWFGPNAFPVPEMADGLLGSTASVELAGDFFQGHLADGLDQTFDAFLRIHLPLWSERAALTVWMPVVEFWRTDATVDAARHILSDPSKDPGHDSGDVYISADFQLVTESFFRPSILLRSVLKTASGNNFGYARYYDSPGYFFDMTVGKSIGPLRIAATTGFLCWQTDNGRQNDAVQYGLAAFFTPGEIPYCAPWLRGLSLSAQFAGYVGWEHHGDSPQTLSARAAYSFPLSSPSLSSNSSTADSPSAASALEPFVMVQHGLRDWPFTQLRLGLLYRW